MAPLPRKNSGFDGDEEEFAEATATSTTWFEPPSSLAPPAEEKEQQQKEKEKEKCEDRGIRDRPVRVYADGISDLFHFEQARALEQAKKLFPNTYLLVGCCSDEISHMYKGRTVMTEDERYESLRHCKWVDEVIPDAPWVLNQEFIDKHNIDYVAHDALLYADASGAGNNVYEFVKAIGKFKETERTTGVSTSDIIMRILKDYNEYVMRNLASGYSEKRPWCELCEGINKFCEKVKEHQENVLITIYTQ